MELELEASRRSPASVPAWRLRVERALRWPSSPALDLVLLLASDRAGNVTGSDFVIDGGLVTTVR